MYPIIHAEGIFAQIDPHSVLYEAPLRQKTTFRIGGTAKAFFAPRSIEALVTVYRRCLEYDIPIYILGGGSNLLITQNLEGIIFSLKHLKKVQKEQGNFLRVQCGVVLNSLIHYAEQHHLGGLEQLIGIPGTVGGALSINAGGKYANIGSVVFLVRTLEKGGELQWKTREECHFEYRNSGLKESLILETILQLKPESTAETLKQSKISVMQEKCRTQPLSAYSAGCVFKNPNGYSVGKLVDEAGLKGYTVGDAMISTQHANFVINRGQATARDVLKVMDKMRETIEARVPVTLQPEIRCWS